MFIKMKKASIYIFLFIIAFTSVYAQGDVAFLEIANGFNQPTAIRNAGDGTDRLFVVERQGIIREISNNTNTFLDITDRVDDSRGEEGLLGLAFHPDYENNGYFYVNYIVNSSTDSTRISRFSVNPNNPNIALPGSELVLLRYAQPFSNHNGGDIHFGPDGYLYIASGDGGSGGDPLDHGQNQNSLLGTILRIDVDNPTSSMNYSIPASNPFGSEVWLYGLRNPWRFSFDRLTNDVYIADVGQNAREEVNVVGPGVGGLNLGWNCREGFISFDGCSGTFHDPIFDYPHSQGRSITGGFVYRGNRFPNFEGWYFFMDFETSRFWQTKGTSQVGLQVVTQSFNNMFITSFGESESGELYAVSITGEVYRIIDQDDCPITRNIPSITQPEYLAQELITSDAVITQDAVYGAMEVQLNSSFEVPLNIHFETLIGICGSN